MLVFWLILSVRLGGAWGGGDTLGADTQCGVGSARGGDDSVPIAGDYTPECPVDDTL